MNYDLLSLILFYGLLYLFYLSHKDKFTIQGKILFMYRTKLGLKLMDSFPRKFPRLVKVLGFLGVVIGFAGMGFIFFYLIKETIEFLITPSGIAPLAPVLPGVKIPGVPTLSFWHWVVSILIVATIHEFSHGILARLHKIKIKSSGFAFLGPLLMAFVEPDEKQMKRKSRYKQLTVFAAGPFSNILTGILFLCLLIFLIVPAYSSLYGVAGISVTNLTEGYPLLQAGIKAPVVISSINGISLDSVESIMAASSFYPGQSIEMMTSQGYAKVKAVEDPNNSSRGIIGINSFEFQAKLKREWASPFLPAIKWVNMLFAWLFMISIGIALFNLLPLGAVDGGRMFLVAMLWIFKDEKKAKRAWSIFSGICLLLIFINLVPWIIKLLAFIISGLSWVIGFI
ncbi:MAG: site-2 protease family protein [Candidatus Nanoarchaeia archaeon]|nr:site-2 protease family protein [Candidatus Nanoarchaeia archaeon]